MIRHRFVLALALVAAIASLTLSPVAAAPVSGRVDQVGWWTNRIGAQEQPQGGFEVAAGPDGSIQSLAALQVTIDVARLSTLEFVLTESSSVGSQLGHLRVCFAAPGWQPANPGELDSAPQVDCSTGAAELARTAEGSWVGDLSRLLPNGGTASLAVVPVSDSPAPVGTGLLVAITGVSITGTGEAIQPTSTTTTAAGVTTTTIVSGANRSFVDTPIINLDPGTVSNPGAAFELPDAVATEPSPALDTATPTTLPTVRPNLAAGITDSGGAGIRWLRLFVVAVVAVSMAFGAVYGRRFLVDRGLVA